MTPESADAILAVARAAVATRDFARAETALAPLVRLDGPERPTNRACIAMAELEEARAADGPAREWLARAARAPRDAAWVADGVVSDIWGPVSPVTGKLDAFRWARPKENLSAFVYEAPVYSPPAAPLKLPDEAETLELVPESAAEPPHPTGRPAPIRSQPVIFPQPKAPDDPGPEVLHSSPEPYGGLPD